MSKAPFMARGDGSKSYRWRQTVFAWDKNTYLVTMEFASHGVWRWIDSIPLEPGSLSCDWLVRHQLKVGRENIWYWNNPDDIRLIWQRLRQTHTQRAHNVYITSHSRRSNVMTLHRRWNDIVLTLRVCWECVVFGQISSYSKSQTQNFLRMRTLKNIYTLSVLLQPICTIAGNLHALISTPKNCNFYSL